MKRLSFEAKLKKLDGLIKSFQEFHEKWPLGKYDVTGLRLEKERVELVSTIGKKK
jgi:hypothetical protein